METKAVAKYIRVSPFKARQVADLIRGKDCKEAASILKYTPKRTASLIQKVLKSAVSNAEHNNNLSEDELYISKIFIDEGPTLKRFRPRAQGRATMIRKRTSHITIVVDRKGGLIGGAESKS